MAGHETQALWALAAGELDAAGKARVESHVAECAACATEWKRVVEARALLHTARSVEPPVRWEETGARLKAAAAKRMARPERRFASPWALTLAACAVALVLWLGGARWRKGGELTPVATRGPEVEAPSAVATGTGDSKERTARTASNAAGQPGPAEEAVAARPEEVPGKQEAVAARPEATPGKEAVVPRPEVAPGAQAVVAARPEAAHTTEAERVTGAVLREATGLEHALATGMRLRSGMAVRTPPKASAVLRLPDESRVRLSAGSDVVFARAESNAVHLTVQQGRLSVNASHAKRDAFLVESAGLRVSVVGTVFSVERTSAGAAVAVLEGRVRVDAEGQPPRFVDAGERVELAGAGEAMKPRALSAGDRQAFRDLRAAEPRPTVASLGPTKKEPSRTSPRQSVATGANPPGATTPAPSGENPAAPSQAVAQQTPDAPEAPRQSVATASNPLEGTQPHASNTEIPQAVATLPRENVPSDEFAPYPGSPANSLASSAPLPAPGTVQAPSMAPATPTEPRKRKTLGALVPGGLLSDDSDERFLGYAKVQTAATTCGQFLVGLGEIAVASPRTGHREQARILRGRCFNKQHQPADAEDEFRQYLREFPNGRYATEARIALGMSAEPEPGAPTQAPAPVPAPAPVTPRWNGSPPQRVPVSPGVPRRW
ncbi:FecR domain-containing protein [Corallococcus carmarthensis]|uniref:FecR domain-containing protein n=1 Tax=Corallococcus carmarthensis TaxID=2316728 RepID=UPI00148C6403|nr:FecR domain-containing protein [Corallococcus carmarthensis]NOK20374.1 VgrG protein [Corallococcus carmarthensis]